MAEFREWTDENIVCFLKQGSTVGIPQYFDFKLVLVPIPEDPEIPPRFQGADSE